MMFVSLQMAQKPYCFFPLHHKGSPVHSLILLHSYFLSLSCNENSLYVRSPFSVPSPSGSPESPAVNNTVFNWAYLYKRNCIGFKGNCSKPTTFLEAHEWRDVENQPSYIVVHAIVFKENYVTGQPPTRLLKTAGADECGQLCCWRRPCLPNRPLHPPCSRVGRSLATPQRPAALVKPLLMGKLH